MVRTLNRVTDSPLLTSSHGGKTERAPWGLFYKDTNPTYESFTLMTNLLPKAPLPNTITFADQDFKIGVSVGYKDSFQNTMTVSIN